MYWIDEFLALFDVSPSVRKTIQLLISLVAVLLPVPVVVAFVRWSRPRQSVLPPYRERVLILGATSGVGRELALQYARRGCRSIAIVGRRKAELDETAAQCKVEQKKGEEWEQSDEAPGWENRRGKDEVLAIQADCTNVDDVVRVRQRCKETFAGVDTVHICYGVSALRPLLGVAGVDPLRPMTRPELLPNQAKQTNVVEADRTGLAVVQEAHQRIDSTNVVGTSVILAAFIPMLQLTSPAPSIHLLSSAAAVIPAPTRSLYGASKAGQLMVFQAAAIEAAVQAKSTSTKQRRAHIRFYACLPGTIKSNFRASAVDGAPDSASSTFDSSWDVKPNGKSDVLLPNELASRIILAVDQNKEGIDEVPSKYWWARRALPFAPSLLAAMARKKYQYN